MITTAIATEIKHVENSFEELNEFGINVNLDNILFQELKQELPNDLINIV